MTDYDTLSRAELTALRADVDRAIATAGDREKRVALVAAEEAARAHGFALADLAELISGGKRRRGGARRDKNAKRGGTATSTAAVAAELRAVRFRNPDDHAQT